MNTFAAYSNYKNSTSLFNVGGLGQSNALGSLNSLNAIRQREANNFLNSFQNQASSPLSFLTSMKENASSFKSSVNSLTGFGANGVFSKKAAQSSFSASTISIRPWRRCRPKASGLSATRKCSAENLAAQRAS